MRLKLEAGKSAPVEPAKSAVPPAEAITRDLAEEARQALATPLAGIRRATRTLTVPVGIPLSGSGRPTTARRFGMPPPPPPIMG